MNLNLIIIYSVYVHSTMLDSDDTLYQSLSFQEGHKLVRKSDHN